MNEFTSTENSEGLLKNDYTPSGLQDALKKKRLKMAKTKLGLETEEEKEKENG